MARTILSTYAIRRELPAPYPGVRVFHAQQAGFERDVELRLYERKRLGDGCDFGPLRWLQRRIGGLDHPNIVPLYDAACTESWVLWTLPLRQALPLEHLIARIGRPLDLAEVVEVGTAVASALAYLHGLGLLHRTLSTATVWYDVQNERPYVADLTSLTDRVARWADVPTVVVPWLDRLTPTPELFTDNPFDRKTDLYLLGALLYHVCTGTPAVTARIGALDAPLLETFAVPPLRQQVPTLPASFENLVGRLLAYDPAGRPESATAVMAELVDCLDPAPVELVEAFDAPPTDEDGKRAARRQSVISSRHKNRLVRACVGAPSAILNRDDLLSAGLGARTGMLRRLYGNRTARVGAVLVVVLLVASLVLWPDGPPPPVDVPAIAAALDRRPITRENFEERYKLLRAALSALPAHRRTGMPTDTELEAMKVTWRRSPSRACVELDIAYRVVASRLR